MRIQKNFTYLVMPLYLDFGKLLGVENSCLCLQIVAKNLHRPCSLKKTNVHQIAQV